MTISEALEQLEGKESNIRFRDLLKICEEFFGGYRNDDGSHYVFKTPWAGDPRINVQAKKGKAKKYQVQQVIKSLKKLQSMGS